MTDTSFQPNDPITREQMAIMLSKAFAYKKGQQSNSLYGDLNSFRDQASVSPWAQESVKLANKFGLLEGFPDGTFRPLARAVRAEAIIVVERMMNGLYE
jgi:hypothetical protein